MLGRSGPPCAGPFMDVFGLSGLQDGKAALEWRRPGARCRPGIVVRGMAAVPHHGVDRGRAPKHFSRGNAMVRQLTCGVGA